jgi:hypothetical protein
MAPRRRKSAEIKIPRLIKTFLKIMYRMLVYYDMSLRAHKPVSAGSYKHIYETTRDELYHIITWDWATPSGIYTDGTIGTSDVESNIIQNYALEHIGHMDDQMEELSQGAYPQSIRHW